MGRGRGSGRRDTEQVGTGRELAIQLAQGPPEPATNPVAHDGRADPSPDGIGDLRRLSARPGHPGQGQVPRTQATTATTKLDEGRAVADAPQRAHGVGRGGRGASGARWSSRQLVAALASASLEDRSPGAGRHAMAEPVVLGSFPVVGLERSFHRGPSWSSPVVASRSWMARPVADRAGAASPTTGRRPTRPRRALFASPPATTRERPCWPPPAGSEAKDTSLVAAPTTAATLASHVRGVTTTSAKGGCRDALTAKADARPLRTLVGSVLPSPRRSSDRSPDDQDCSSSWSRSTG